MRVKSYILEILGLAAAALMLAGCGRTHAEVRKPAPALGPHFTDVTQAAGINYRWVIPGPRPLNILQTIGNGCALLDYNNDGNLDILLVGSKLALYQGDGHGHFTDVTHQTGLDTLSGHFLGCAVGDYDNDGFDDIYLTAYRGGVLLHNEAGKGFKDVTQEAGIKPQPWGTSAAFVDADNDGLLDLFIGNYAVFGPNTQPQLCRQNGFQTACGPRFYQPEKGVLYHNEGHGRFQDVTDRWKARTGHGKDLGVACADYAGKGRQSIALANDEVPGDLLDNQGHVFLNRGAESGIAYDANGIVHGGMGEDWGDYDNDGRPDLAVATFQNEPKNIYHNDGGGFFTDRSTMLGVAARTQPYVAFGIKWLDIDNDGWLDLVIANGHVQDNIHDIDKSTTYLQPVQLLRNNGGMAFEDVGAAAGPAFSAPILGRGLAIGDFDNDGRMDVLVVDSEGTPLLLHNETPNAGHWLLLTLEGTKSNRDGIGAMVTAEVG
ncbi:MAG TPA: VCBS repeat-containing protein, partial [Chthonomonadaceae bacterium]|nr:VCBS repeat-containing protein [Chthonomonadaceae bacterium]